MQKEIKEPRVARVVVTEMGVETEGMTRWKALLDGLGRAQFFFWRKIAEQRVVSLLQRIDTG